MFTSSRVISIVRDRMKLRDEFIQVYWCQVTQDREIFRTEIIASISSDDCSIVPLVLRGKGFQSPNAVLSDLFDLLNEHRTIIEPIAEQASSSGLPLALLIISLTDFQLPQISSPMTLPPWFPHNGGQLIHVFIEDLRKTATVSLSAPEANLESLCNAVFELELAIVDRLRAVHQVDHNRINSLFDKIRQPNDGKFLEVIERMTMFLSSVKNRSNYRPSAKDPTFTSCILRLATKSSPDELNAVGKALSSALALEPNLIRSFNESLITVILRPTNRTTEDDIRFARNVFITIYASCQFITAAAHADDYPNYSLHLVQTFSRDMRQSLSDMNKIIRQAGLPEKREN